MERTKTDPCDAARRFVLDAGWTAADRAAAAAALAHVERCRRCRAAVADFDALRAVLAGGPGVARPPVRRVGPAFGRLAAGVVLAAAVGVGGYVLGRRPTVTPVAVAAAPAVAPPLASADVAGRVAAFEQVSRSFDGRADWLMVSDTASDVGLGSAGASASRSGVLLLRLSVAHRHVPVSSADLAILPGRTAALSLPFPDHRTLHYDVTVGDGDPTRVTVWADLRQPAAADGVVLASLATTLDLRPGRAEPLGSFVTGAGAYELSVAFSRAALPTRGDAVKAAVVAMVLALSHGGQWLAGHRGTATLAWPVDRGLPPAVLAWDLRLGPTVVAHGSADVPAADRPVTVAVDAPGVRIATDLRFTYHLTARTDPASDLAAGGEVVRVYPDDLIGDFGGRYAGRRVVVVGGGMAEVLGRAKVRCEPVAHADRVDGRPDLLLIGPDTIGPGPFAQPDAVAIATAGGQVVCFRQDRPAVLAGYALARRDADDAVVWRTDHALLAGLSDEVLAAWARSSPGVAVRLPADAAALEVGYWRREVPAAAPPAPIDALVVTRTVGAGRIVFCQLPPLDADDPRWQLLLRNVLAYGLTRPEPTVPPSRRTAVGLPSTVPVPTITIPTGDRP